MDLLTHLNLDKRFQDQTADWLTALVKETEGNQLVNYYLGGGFKYSFFIFTPSWGNDPIWLIFFKWVGSTTN